MPVQLTAEQYTHAEDLYWKVMQRCCIRKPGSAKIHHEIEKMVLDGRPDQAILADFSRRYGGQVNLDRVPVDSPKSGSDWMLVPAAGAAAVLGFLMFRNRRAKASSDPVTR
jgi:cytochrome c-type biogenesis protein CcmH/NrfF